MYFLQNINAFGWLGYERSTFLSNV